jgi:hypothetical protein
MFPVSRAGPVAPSTPVAAPTANCVANSTPGHARKSREVPKLNGLMIN